MRTPSASGTKEVAALRKVIGSSSFVRNPRLSALLEYLCQESLEGRTAIKEYAIATDVFGRPPEFDQTTDAIVRVEMHRLRKKLKEYYAAEGAQDDIQIVLNTGRYIPEFVERPAIVQEVVPSDETHLSLQSTISIEHSTATGLVNNAPGRRSIGNSARFSWPWLPIALASVLVLSFGVWQLWHHRQLATVVPVISAKSDPLPVLPPTASIRIRCGFAESGFHDRRGHYWGHDAYFSGGSALRIPVQPIFRTRDAALFQSARTGEFSYSIPLKNGLYELRLYFADTSYHPGLDMEGGEGTRTFSVFLNGKKVLHDLDILADAGPNTAAVRVFKDIAPAADGYLHLGFAKQIGEPLLNAIEITPGTPHALNPIRLLTQDREFVDHNGSTWLPDDFFLQGRISSRFGTINGPFDPQLYERERYGNFSYAIPVSSGRYKLTLHFAESYWGPEGPGGGGVGSRIFDVYCNGTTLISNLDMFKEVGANHQIAKVFHGLQPNAQGTLLLSFVPRVNYANISAIEVDDESER